MVLKRSFGVIILVVFILGFLAGFEVGFEYYRSNVSQSVNVSSSGAGVYRVLTDKDYYDTLRWWLDRANKSVHVIMYVIKYDPKQYNDPVNILLYTLADLKRRGVDVKIIVDDTTMQSYPETISFLKNMSISIKLDESASKTTHAKIVIIDGYIVFIGSHNWTESALTRNHEVSVVIYDQSVGESMIRYFEDIWSKGRSI
ncbi:MAG: phospholipase D-like domain-containing protein [Sulfolobales archaeon]